jgi:hypothetical protein
MDSIIQVKGKSKPSFLVKLFIFISIIIIFDFVIGAVLKILYHKQESGWLYRTSYAIDSTKADVLVFGDSRANHHYCPAPFEKRMHLSYYNVGSEGYPIFYHYAILCGVLKRYSPKIIILDFSHGEFKKSTKSYDRISALLPYYETHPEIRPIIQIKGPYEKYKLLSKIYPYNSLVYSIAIGNSEFNKGRRNNDDKQGYVPLKNVWKKPIAADSTYKKYEIDSVKINIFKSFIKDCNDNNIKLFVICSPYFINFKYIDTSMNLAKEITKQMKVPFYDFSNTNTFSNNADLFSDIIHLNFKGSRIYTDMVIDKMIENQHKNPLMKESNSSSIIYSMIKQ